jgi:glycosyltransferase involved in cell wall biosynthesis
MPKTAIIVPCYNEATRIQQRKFLQCCELLRHVSFIFINDGSNDDTILILTKLENINPRQITTINLSKNKGKGEAVRQGVLYAIRNNFDYIGYWDADLSTPLENIKTFIDLLNESPHRDIVMGARVQMLGRSIYRKAARHYIGRIFATAVSIMLRLPVYDTQCGSKIFRNTPIFKELFAAPFLTKWIFDVEILARYLSASNSKLKQILTEKIIEYPLQSWFDIPGSKIKFKDFAGSGLELAHIWFYYRKNLRKTRVKNDIKIITNLNTPINNDRKEKVTPVRFADSSDTI